MPTINLKLGSDMEEGLLAAPTSAPTKYYPSFRIEADEKPELPHSGTMTIRFKKTSSEEREDSDGDAHYSCTIEVHEVIDAYPDSDAEPPARNRNKETGEALDALKANRKKKSDY